ncbi:hypothetical protein D9611_006147 [Ephemerocybe angulata]|uniref:Uncharacterized protein n=1 Tax=Ephemerocybe angulata TaxID=980116 RepID=A0A8H5CG23_9AGAR|nr:hypothetical protein D9611_006147 [Tulosesus angulatus]
MAYHLSYSLSEENLTSKDLSSGDILDVFSRNSSWVWVEEENYVNNGPNAPGNEQRAFRKTFINNDISKIPVSTTIVLTVDNYFALYVNGILLHAVNATDSWQEAFAFTVPISGARTLYALRAINKLGDTGAPSSYAGFRAAVRIKYNDGSSQIFQTGMDQTWLGNKLFGEGWEQPEYDDRDWKAAKVLDDRFKTSIWAQTSDPTPKKILVASDIPALPPSSTVVWKEVSTDTSQNLDSTSTSQSRAVGSHTDITKAQLAGSLIGAILIASILSAMVTFLFTRRRYKTN